MGKRHNTVKTLLTVFFTLTLAVSCAIDVTPPDKPVANGQEGIQMVFSIPNRTIAQSTTKTIDAITQTGTENYFHGMKDIRMFPFPVNRKITANDVSNQSAVLLLGAEADDTPAASYAIFRRGAFLIPVGTSSFLFYGCAPDNTLANETVGSPSFKMRNGSLIAEGLNSGKAPASNISFRPEQICTSEVLANVNATAAAMAAFLTDVVNTSFTQDGLISRNSATFYVNNNATFTGTWRDIAPNAPNLSAILDRFLNYSGTEYKIVGGSGSLVAAWLNELSHTLDNYVPTSEPSANTAISVNNWVYYHSYRSAEDNDPYTVAEACATIKSELKSKIIASISGVGTETPALLNTSLSEFPTSFGLPDGAIGIQWQGTQFGAVAQGTKGAIEKYCYPPRLWYFANSVIRTSSSSDNASQYPPTDGVSRYNRWDDILKAYGDGPTVLKETQAIALVDSVQYGVALLTVKLKQASATIPDATGDPEQAVTVGTDKFPLTAIFVGGQRQQTFNFTPVSTGDDFVSYDGCLNRTVCLSSASDSEPVNTLVLQTLPDEKIIYLAVEFRNNSGSAFLGQDGTVPNGGTFYLLGQINYDERLPSSGTSPLYTSVFVKDHRTFVTISVTSLAAARNVIPNLSIPQLDLGVQINIDWTQSTSTSVPMY